MADRNTMFGWVLFAGIAALGSYLVSSEFFAHEPMEKKAYAISGVESAGGTVAAATPIAVLLAKADPAKGAAVFAQCATCHNDAAGAAAKTGPNLYGVLGRSVGSAAGFDYSADVKKIGGKWDFEKLNAWLTNPKALAAGTKMSYAGLDNEQSRADLIAWLNTQGSNLPLPKPEAAKPADAKAGDAKAPAAKS